MCVCEAGGREKEKGASEVTSSQPASLLFPGRHKRPPTSQLLKKRKVGLRGGDGLSHRPLGGCVSVSEVGRFSLLDQPCGPRGRIWGGEERWAGGTGCARGGLGPSRLLSAGLGAARGSHPRGRPLGVRGGGAMRAPAPPPVKMQRHGILSTSSSRDIWGLVPVVASAAAGLPRLCRPPEPR